MKQIFVLLLIALTFAGCSPKLNGKMADGFYEKGVIANGKKIPVSEFTKEGSTVFYMVRHAEKQEGKDPDLTTEGLERAKKLAKMLKEVDIKGIYSTSRKRTIYTAAPTAEVHKLEINSYKNPDRESLLNGLKQEKGSSFLIVGHSNTIPEMLNLFQKKKVYEHIDESIYDNLFVVITNGEGDAKIIELKY